MSVIIDHSLPPGLARRLQNWSWVSQSEHVQSLGWSRADDLSIWRAARESSALILTKDKDFAAISLARGAPPKVILCRFGNCSAAEVERRVLTKEDAIRSFAEEDGLALLILEATA